MLSLRASAKRCVVSLLGDSELPHRIAVGLAGGSLIFASPSKNLGYIVGTADKPLQRAIKNYVARGDTVYDIGANIGYVSLMLARQVGPAGQVVAFEPIRDAFDVLRRNVFLNGMNHVKLLNTAAAATCGESIMRTVQNLSMSSMVWHRNDDSAVEVFIKTVAIDDLIISGEIVAAKFVKIDVEGAEGLVLEGMSRMVASAQPVIFLECSEIGRRTTWELLHDLGYHCQSPTTDKVVHDFEEYRHADFVWLPQHAVRSGRPEPH